MASDAFIHAGFNVIKTLVHGTSLRLFLHSGARSEHH
jgi:hypothetical protein